MDKRDLDFAEQASIDVFDDAGFWVGKKVSWEKLISLIRADEREKFMSEPLTKAMRDKYEADIRADEREACAKVCDEMEEKAEEHGTECCKWPTPSDCAFAIRARGNT